MEPNKRACNQDVIDWLADKKPDLLFEPGKEFRYSNTGYVILASIVEDASGLAFSDYLQRNIFEPLGMNSCFSFRQKWHANFRLDQYALGHRFDSAANKFVAVNRNMPPKSVYHYSLRSIDGDGNVVGTLADFVKFEQGLANNKLRIGDLMWRVLSAGIRKRWFTIRLRVLYRQRQQIGVALRQCAGLPNVLQTILGFWRDHYLRKKH